MPVIISVNSVHGVIICISYLPNIFKVRILHVHCRVYCKCLHSPIYSFCVDGAQCPKAVSMATVPIICVTPPPSLCLLTCKDLLHRLMHPFLGLVWPRHEVSLGCSIGKGIIEHPRGEEIIECWRVDNPFRIHEPPRADLYNHEGEHWLTRKAGVLSLSLRAFILFNDTWSKHTCFVMSNIIFSLELQKSPVQALE